MSARLDKPSNQSTGLLPTFMNQIRRCELETRPENSHLQKRQFQGFCELGFCKKTDEKPADVSRIPVTGCSARSRLRTIQWLDAAELPVLSRPTTGPTRPFLGTGVAVWLGREK